jgi:hypothetical protein
MVMVIFIKPSPNFIFYNIIVFTQITLKPLDNANYQFN